MAEKCVAAAAVRLVLFHPFWCELYYSMKIIEEPAIATLATDGTHMWVNPKFWETLTLDYKVSALAHESCHKMLHHCTRGLDFIQPWSNIAADIVVNTMLAKNGFKIAPTWVQPEAQYEGWTFEAVYKDITKNIKPPPPNAGGGQGKPGDGSPVGGGNGVPQKWAGAWRDIQKFKGTPAEIENFEQKVEQAVAKAIATAKAQGHTPWGVEMAMDKIAFRSEEKWYDHLRRYMQALRHAEYDWAKINKRQQVVFGIVGPDLHTEALREAVIFRDASGSCFDAAVQAGFNGQVSAILADAKPQTVHVVDFDVIVHKHTEVDVNELDFSEPPVGGGGTSFQHLIPWVEENNINPDVVIILTDMYGDFPTEVPPYPVIWASTSPGIKGPFGETIYIH